MWLRFRYDFTDGDLSVSLTQMHEYLNAYADIPFKVLRFLFTEINYGGRVTDGKDRRLINNFVINFCNDGVLSPGYSFSPSATYTTSCASSAHCFPPPPATFNYNAAICTVVS
jgi:dynein heavy chain, axonemal